ncbi:addiction module antitoxin RelB [Trinickia dabaoshanensis]|uniref:Addiction module antitoxin RelB n=1 Tax=Trinickia dabaoshanensis TaxID=564714 RepID=A0A2N7VUW4_9BURK|nr:type II toxin-antitoxin system RelE/ParE family toxin [Trinickia dabaoshanensis]PMS20919.1 addiction module antitoxin RelB [Trinickia dabaoshanensis]
MNELRITPEFADWIDTLRDLRARAQIQVRIQRLVDGNPGDVRPVGCGVSELRVHCGPGYRVYYTERRGVFLLLLCGGDKSTQDSDIKQALRMARELEG